MAKRHEPLEALEWVDRDTITPNDYNPNQQSSPEKKLLITSIMEDGWTQPIVLDDQNEIVDGFHRWEISGRKALKERYKNQVPVVRLAPKSREERMMSTIRHNRARGVHHVDGMASIVQTLIEAGKTFPEIQHSLGMDPEEVERFAIKCGIPRTKEIIGHTLGRAWVPATDQDVADG